MAVRSGVSLTPSLSSPLSEVMQDPKSRAKESLPCHTPVLRINVSFVTCPSTMPLLIHLVEPGVEILSGAGAQSHGQTAAPGHRPDQLLGRSGGARPRCS